MKLYEYGYLIEALKKTGGEDLEKLQMFAGHCMSADHSSAMSFAHEYLCAGRKKEYCDLYEAVYMAIMEAYEDHKQECAGKEGR